MIIVEEEIISAIKSGDLDKLELLVGSRKDKNPVIFEDKNEADLKSLPGGAGYGHRNMNNNKGYLF